MRTIFFATSHGKNTESALPLMNLLDILSVTSIFKVVAPAKFHVLKLDHFQPSCSSCHVIFKKCGFIPK